jgi:hypothetical protein
MDYEKVTGAAQYCDSDPPGGGEGILSPSKGNAPSEPEVFHEMRHLAASGLVRSSGLSAGGALGGTGPGPIGFSHHQIA